MKKQINCNCKQNYHSSKCSVYTTIPQEPMEWESELGEIILLTDKEIMLSLLTHLIQSQIKQAEEREREKWVNKIKYLVERAKGENLMIPPETLETLINQNNG